MSKENASSESSVPSRVGCPLCGTPGQPLFTAMQDYNLGTMGSLPMEIGYCAPCAIGVSEPYLNYRQLAACYPSDYPPYRQATGKTAWLLGRICLRDLKRLERVAQRPQRTLFELGVASGDFLAMAKRRGYEVAGLEPDAQARGIAELRLGTALGRGAAEQFTFERRYDAVVARHSLEHMNGVREILERIFQQGLHSGGVLLVKIPCCDSWERKLFGRFWTGWDLPRHRVHFTRRGIRAILEAVGFLQVEIRSEVYPTDWMASLANLDRFQPTSVTRAMAKTLRGMPYLVQLALGQSTALMLSPFSTGRIVVTAVRP